MMLGYLKAAEQQPLLILLGALAAAFGAVMNFYFGSSQGSKDKNDLLANSTPAR
jgi:membrane protein DedA with SNARE-associated domain